MKIQKTKFFHFLDNAVLTSQRVADAMAQVDRKNYCPAGNSYRDCPQSIGS